MACKCGLLSVAQSDFTGYYCQFGSQVCISQFYKVEYEYSNCYDLGQIVARVVRCNERAVGACCTNSMY